jgi:molybdopterin-guanine dinucleotide biosynthesis protein A
LTVAGTLGVLVAGGAGTRLGLGIPKALVRVGGATLLQRGVRTLAAICDDLVVAAPAELALAVPSPMSRGADAPPPARAFDPPGASGPLAGVVAGLSSRAFERAVVLAVDLPFATSAALAALLERLGRHDAIVPAPGGVPQPLAAAYAAAARPLLAAKLHAGERSLTRALDSLDAVRLDDDALARLPGGLENFFNLNTRDDLAEAERRLAAREGAR